MLSSSINQQQPQLPLQQKPESQDPSYPYQTNHSCRPQDRLGILPDVLFQARSFNSTRKTQSSRKLELLWSYLPDWIVVVTMGIIFALIDRVHGHHREFDLNDPTIQFSYTLHERVPVPLLIFLSVIIPAILITLTSQFLLRSSWDSHIGLLGLALSLSLSLAVTAITKVTVGRPRPDMLSRCQPSPGATNAGSPTFGLSNSTICTAPVDSRMFQDGFRSFPSGHSSTAWAGLGFLSLYLAGKLHLFDRRGHSIKVWIAIAPLFGAALIAISRTMDYRHHWHDVLIGSTLGALTAWFSYRYYYPNLSSSHCHRPYSPRVPSSKSIDHEPIEEDHRSEDSRASFQGADVENQLIETAHPDRAHHPAHSIDSPPQSHRRHHHPSINQSECTTISLINASLDPNHSNQKLG